jgi:hypothetical protein
MLLVLGGISFRWMLPDEARAGKMDFQPQDLLGGNPKGFK